MQGVCFLIAQTVKHGGEQIDCIVGETSGLYEYGILRHPERPMLCDTSVGIYGEKSAGIVIGDYAVIVFGFFARLCVYKKRTGIRVIFRRKFCDHPPVIRKIVFGPCVEIGEFFGKEKLFFLFG